MTPLQSACLTAIRDLTKGEVSPSFEMLRVRLNLSSKSHVHRLVEALKAQGRVETDPRFKRSIRIIEAKPDLSKLSMGGLRDLIANAQAELEARVGGRCR